MIDFCIETPSLSSVNDAEYLPVIRSLLENAVERVLCSVFIVDLDPAHDSDLLVHDVMLDLQRAHWRGVDVRLLVGGSRSSYDIAVTAETARAFGDWLGVNCRWLTSQDVRGSHTKFAVADDHILTGSHNWSGGAFSGQIQDSLLFNSATLAEQFRNTFEYQWWRARETP